jgi:hypothetical protein
MNKLEQAIEIEKKYLAHRMNNEEPFHLVDEVIKLGYSSLEEYFKDKQDYIFSLLKFEYIEKSPVDCITEVLRMIKDKITGVLFVDTEDSFVFYGNDCEYNSEYCELNGIASYPIFTNGGCIVSSKGDFSVGICCPSNTNIGVSYILKNIASIINKYIDGVEVSGNDILINGKKVLGSASYNQNGMFMFVAHVSFVDSSDIVDRICKKTTAKEPWYINGLSREKFKQEVLEWLLIH